MKADCFKNIKIHRKGLGLYPYFIRNHPIKDVDNEIEIIYADLYTEGGSLYHLDADAIGSNIEGDKHCIYVKCDTYEGKPVSDIVVRTRYFYEVHTPENMPLN